MLISTIQLHTNIREHRTTILNLNFMCFYLEDRVIKFIYYESCEDVITSS
jgi:hypothetical protein